MRGLPARRAASTALCAALLAGIGAPAAMAADSTREHSRAAAPGSPLPDADALLDQVKNLGDLDSRLAPIRDLLTAVLTSGTGALSAADATKLGDAAKDALAKADAAVAAATAATATAPRAGSAPAVPFTTAAAQAAPAERSVLLPAPAVRAAAPGAAPASRQRAADPASDALTALRTALDNLLKAVTSGDTGQVLPAVTGLMKGLTDLVGSAVPDTGLTALPSTSATAPAAVSASTLPALTIPDITLPAEPPAAPAS
ncbi:hypothetical protein ABZ858_18560 [Streptomyces sp. NPDC047017]|uniref:hypothetical protein n=1 Tax=Streptomyces sp. NPDC047017 TaxID=3155024 RepID=UPI00340482EA